MPYNRLSFLKRLRVPLILLGFAYGLLNVSCGQIKYVPVKGETQVEYRDSIITRLDTLTVTRTEVERVRDYTGLLDTLRMQTKGAVATAWIDTAASALKGTLEDKDTPIQVVVPSTNEYHLKDSASVVQVPVPIEIEKVVKTVPKFWRVTGVLGIIETLVLLLLGFWKIRTSGFTSKILKIFKK